MNLEDLIVSVPPAVAERLDARALWINPVIYDLRQIGDGLHVRGVPAADSAALSMPEVAEPLAEMLDRGPGSLDDPAFAARCWLAVETLAEVSGQQTIPHDHPMRIEPQLPHIDQFALGVAEESAYREMPELVSKVLPPEYADRLNRVPLEHPELLPRQWPAGSAMAAAFAERLGAEAGMSPDEVLRRLARETPPELVPAAVEIAAGPSRLPELVPDWQQRNPVPGARVPGPRSRIEQSLHQAIARTAPERGLYDPRVVLSGSEPPWPAPDGLTPEQTGTRMADELIAAVREEQTELVGEQASDVEKFTGAAQRLPGTAAPGQAASAAQPWGGGAPARDDLER